ncbi:PHB domain-containing protein [Psidium guajava]|nr:PHB domain-containing protein [Psidium guajava]
MKIHFVDVHPVTLSAMPTSFVPVKSIKTVPLTHHSP